MARAAPERGVGMSGPERGGRRGPKALGDVLGDLFAAKGFGRLRAAGELEAAWAEAVGEPAARQSRPAGLRHGVLTVTVAHPALLEELAAFRKAELLAALRTALPATRLLDLRFRVGPVEPDPAPPARPGPAPGRGRRKGG
jgi:predicted nucleic acid-binding Zn ribbon protein